MTAPLVYGYKWDPQIMKAAKEEKKLLRITVAIPGGSKDHECNLNCIFCFTDGGKKKHDQRVVTNDDCLRFFKEAREFAYDPELLNYFFVSEGEPTLNENLVDVLYETSKFGGTMTIFTNLIHLTDEQVKAFREIKNLFVCGKLYGMRPETNDYLTGQVGSYEKIMANIEKLKEAGLAKEGRLGVQCVATSTNYDELPDIFKWGRKNNIIPHIMQYRAQGRGNLFPEFSLTLRKSEDFFNQCKACDAENNIFGSPYFISEECDVPGTNLYLKSDGDVQVCAGDTRSYGNYFETSVAQMMDSQFFRDVADNYAGCPWVYEK